MGRSVYRKILVWVAIIAAAALLILFSLKGINHRYFFYEGRTILRSSEEIDLRDMELTFEQYEQLKAELPGCNIRWMIPIGDSIYDSAATVLRISSLEAEHIPMYMYFDDLQRIYAEDCEDYDEIKELQSLLPNCEIIWMAHLGDSAFYPDSGNLSFFCCTDRLKNRSVLCHCYGYCFHGAVVYL